jgi:hypothetical protein
MMWRCDPCRVAFPIDAVDRIRRHLNTKRHERLKWGCPECGGAKLVDIPNEFWDADGIRPAKKCTRCKTEFKSYSHGITAKDSWEEYTGEWPEAVKKAEAESFHRQASARGYVKAPRSTRSPRRT